jgi:hypothetical protein
MRGKTVLYSLKTVPPALRLDRHSLRSDSSSSPASLAGTRGRSRPRGRCGGACTRARSPRVPRTLAPRNRRPCARPHLPTPPTMAAHSARPADPPACPAGPRARPRRAAGSGSRPQRHLARGRRRASSCQPKTGTSGADTAPPSRGRRRGGAARPRDFMAPGHERRAPVAFCRRHSTAAGVVSLQTRICTNAHSRS